MEQPINLKDIAEEHSDDPFPFFVQSFQHSQGDANLQRQIFVWAKKSTLLDNFTDFPGDEMVRDKLKMPAHHREPRPGQRFLADNMWGDLLAVRFEKDPPYLKGSKDYKEFKDLIAASKDEVLFRIAKGIIERDRRFQDIDRQVKNDQERDDGPHDAHASFFRRHVVLGRPTGSPIFDQMYEEVGKLIDQYKSTKYSFFHLKHRARQTELMNVLGILQARWELHHSGQEFFPSDNKAA